MLRRPHRQGELAVSPGVLVGDRLGVGKSDLRHDPCHVSQVFGSSGHLDLCGEDLSSDGAQGDHRVEPVVNHVESSVPGGDLARHRR